MRGTKNDILVMFSGGMDSTISLYEALGVAHREGSQVHALTFSYGQRHANEIKYARAMMMNLLMRDSSDTLGQFVIHKLHFPLIPGSLIGGDPVTKYEGVEDTEHKQDNSFIPYRNLIMLSTAAVYAYKWGCSIITTGLRGGFPDCTEEFERAVERILYMAVPEYHVRIVTPTHRSRAECIKRAQELPGCMEALAFTLTCFEGTRPPCGHCLPCIKRAEGFAQSGVEDPLLGAGTGTFQSFPHVGSPRTP